MLELNSLFDSQILNEKTAVTVGKFDGVHKGHAYLYTVINDKKKDGYSSLVLTFSNSVRDKLNNAELGMLITDEERKVMMESQGIDFLVNCPFDDKMRSTSARDFIKALCDNLNMKFMVVGDDFRFGYKGAGDTVLLKELSTEFGFELLVVNKIKSEDRDISSTFVREELSKGNVEKVNELLGYEYFVWGEVVHGAHLGHKIGIPTINITPPLNKLLPANGVYVTNCIIDGKIYGGVTNVGCKPSVKSDGRIGIETHILDFDGDLYGKAVKVIFHKKLRSEMKFASVDELANQMRMDIKRAKECSKKN